MTQGKWAEEFIDFMQSNFESTLKTLETLQDQGEKMVNTLMDQGFVAQQEGRKVISEWFSMARKGRAEFARTMLDNLDKIEDLFVAAPAAEKGKEK